MHIDLDLLLCRPLHKGPLIFAVDQVVWVLLINFHVHCHSALNSWDWFVIKACNTYNIYMHTYNTVVNLINVKVCNILPCRAFTLPQNSKSAWVVAWTCFPSTLPCTGYTHVSDVWFRYTFKMKATNSFCACRVFCSPCEMVWANNAEPELRPRVNYWGCKTWTEEIL